MCLKINEIFKSIQGEGIYQGHVAVFLRLSGCTRQCTWCDTKQHTKYKEMDINEVVDSVQVVLRKNPTGTWISVPIVLTGGEPLLYSKHFEELTSRFPNPFHIETNGDLIGSLKQYDKVLAPYFDYVCISPKDVKTAKRVSRIIKGVEERRFTYAVDIKVVTDLKSVGVDILKYATMLMPYTTYNYKKDLETKQRVWDYCVDHNLKYSARLHVEVWKQTKRK